jgi:hypothetical protein
MSLIHLLLLVLVAQEAVGLAAKLLLELLQLQTQVAVVVGLVVILLLKLAALVVPVL